MRLVRGLALVWVGGILLFILALIVASSAEAATPSDPLASPTHWSAALVAGFVATQIIPVIAALATKKPNHWTGVITAVLAFVDMLCSNIAESGDGVDWKQVIITSFLAFLAARLIAYKGIIEGTPWGKKLYGSGNKGPSGT